MTTLIIVRHGQSVSNLTKTFAGQSNSPLTPLGLEQAELASRYLDKFNFDAVYSSPLSRAYDTAATIIKNTPLEIICDDSLKETHLGDWEGLPIDSVREEYQKWRTEYDYAPPNGESTHQVRERTGRAVDRIARENYGKTVLVASHGGCIRLLPSYFGGNDDSLIATTPIASNVSITTVVYENGVGSVKEYAYDGYLGEMKTVFDNGR